MNVYPEECFAFSTKDRAPVFLCIELVDCDMLNVLNPNPHNSDPSYSLPPQSLSQQGQDSIPTHDSLQSPNQSTLIIPFWTSPISVNIPFISDLLGGGGGGGGGGNGSQKSQPPHPEHGSQPHPSNMRPTSPLSMPPRRVMDWDEEIAGVPQPVSTIYLTRIQHVLTLYSFHYIDSDYSRLLLSLSWPRPRPPRIYPWSEWPQCPCSVDGSVGPSCDALHALSTVAPWQRSTE